MYSSPVLLETNNNLKKNIQVDPAWLKFPILEFFLKESYTFLNR